jgi:putative ABC transport system ATP-binding protein
MMVGGKPVQNMSDDALSDFRARHLGFVFQNFNLLPVLTAFENIEYPLVLAGMAPQRRHARAKALLDAVGLTDHGKKRPNQLSGGQRQRVAIARALVNRPAILLADEPTGNLDSRTTEEILTLFGDLHRQGQTIILVTHDPAVARHAHRIVRVKDGRIEADGGAEALIAAGAEAGR